MKKTGIYHLYQVYSFSHRSPRSEPSSAHFMFGYSNKERPTKEEKRVSFLFKKKKKNSNKENWYCIYYSNQFLVSS